MKHLGGRVDRRTLVCGIATTLIGASAIGRPARAAATEELSSLRVGTTMADDLTPVYYAVKAGLYKKAGLDVTLTVLRSGSAVAEGVISGGLDIGKSSLVNLFNAHDHGVPIELTTAGAIYDTNAPFAQMVVAADSPMKSPKDLEGQLIGVPYLNDFNELVTKMWVSKNGGDVDKLKFVEVPNTAERAAIEQHRIAAALLQEPELSEALAGGKLRILGKPYDAIGPSFMFAAWFGRKDWVAEHHNLVNTFNRVTAEAVEYTNAHPEATTDMMSEATKIPLAVFSKMSRVKSAASLEPGMVQPLIDAAAKYKAIPRGFAAKEFIFSQVPMGKG